MPKFAGFPRKHSSISVKQEFRIYRHANISWAKSANENGDDNILPYL